MEYCCHVWVGVPSCYLDMLYKLLKQICRVVASILAASLKPLGYCRNVASLSLSLGITLVGDTLNWLNWFRFLILLGGSVVILTGCMIFMSLFLDAIWISIDISNFFPPTVRPWFSLPAECFPLTMIIRNGKMVWKVVWIEYYLPLNLSFRRI